MRKQLIKWFAGDPIKTARLILPLAILAALSLGFGAVDSLLTIVLLTLLVTVTLVGFGANLYFDANPPKREELDEKGKEIYDKFNK